MESTSLTFEGYVEVIGSQQAIGWAWNASCPTERVQVTARLGGEIIGELIADDFRPDLLTAGIGDGYHAFKLSFERTLSQEELAAVIIQANGGAYVVPIAPNAIKVDESFANDKFNGCIDNINRHGASGWVWNESRPTKRLEVIARLRNMIIAESKADVWRPDLAAAGIGDGCYSFSLKFARVLSKQELAAVAIEVTGKPYVLSIAQQRVTAWIWDDMYVPVSARRKL